MDVREILEKACAEQREVMIVVRHGDPHDRENEGVYFLTPERLDRKSLHGRLRGGQQRDIFPLSKIARVGAAKWI